jgi:putative addiction module component (TIGR02574 family)
MRFFAMTSQNIFDQALTLSAAERTTLVEQLFVSLDEPNKAIDALLADEVERRVDAYDKGEMRSIPAEQVFAKLESNWN